MKGMGVLFALLGLSMVCAAIAIYGHIAGWSAWALGALWILSIPAISAAIGSVAGLFSPRG